jgi:hypothetical protein
MYILNEDIDNPKPGDIRPFKTKAGIGDRKLESLRIVVHDALKQYPQEKKWYGVNVGDPVAIIFGPPSGFNGTLPLGEISPFSISVVNISSDNIIIQPYDLTFEVYKTDANYQMKDLVYSYKMPKSNGTLGHDSGYSVKIPWNQRGLDGRFITAGKYAVRLKAPTNIQYFIEGSNDVKTYPLYLRSSGFNIEFKNDKITIGTKN